MPEAHNNAMLRTRPVVKEDSATWLRLRCELWPDGIDDHASEVEAFFAGMLVEPEAVLVCEESRGKIVAFAELSVRKSLPNLAGVPVGYVEGLYVIPEFRGQGAARLLLRSSQDWARERSCMAFASDRADRLIIDPNFMKSDGGPHANSARED